MKKLIIASGVALVAFATVASAMTTATFTRNLTVTSTGADVTALQTWLIGKGYTIPAGATGYFGSQTQAAVKAFQVKAGIINPGTGFVGPLTLKVLNGGDISMSSAMSAMTSCPVGYDCVPKAGTVVAPAATNADGSITLSSSSYVSSSQTLKKGDMDKPIISATAQATAGAVTVTRFDVHFSSRPWLLFSGLTLKDQTGNVLATKTLASSADATEVTVGSDYLVRFDGVNTVVTPGTMTTFIVRANILAASDKITGQTITVSIPSGSIRTINGKGYTDSLGYASGNTTAITLSSTGSTGDLNTRVGATPDSQTVNVSTSNVTSDQVLGVFDVKLVNQSGIINQMNFNINNSKAYNGSTLFQNVRLYDGSTLLAGAYSFTGTLATFVNLNIPVTVDQWKSLTLKADVLATSSAFAASSTIVSASIIGVDSNYNTITLLNASNRSSNDTTFVPNAGLQITNITPVKGNVVTASNSSIWGVAYPSISFTVVNTGNNPIYISKNPSVALATTTSAGVNASTTVSSVNASGQTTGDTSVAYIVNASRTFTYNFTVDNTNGTSAAKKLSLTQINYGTAGITDGTAATQTAELNVNYGLTNAFVQIP